MKTTLDQLSARTMSLISEFAEKNDIDAITRLSDAASRIKTLLENLAVIQHDAADLERFLSGFASQPATELPANGSPVFDDFEFESKRESDTRAKRKTLRIEIEWERLGKSGGREVICERMASDTVTKFIQRLYGAFGLPALEKLSTFKISRGPLLSRAPEHDFMNRSRGTLYSHQRVLGTPFYVLTHSQTSQKVGDINEAAKFLRFPIGAVKVSETEQ